MDKMFKIFCKVNDTVYDVDAKTVKEARKSISKTTGYPLYLFEDTSNDFNMDKMIERRNKV